MRQLARIAPEVRTAELRSDANLGEQVDLDSMDFLSLLIGAGQEVGRQNMLFGVTVLPISAGDTIADPVADVVQRIEDAGLPYQVNGTSTVIEAEWDDVMPLLRTAERELQRRYKRVFMLITIDDHVGVTGRLSGAVADIDERVEHTIPLS